MSRSSRIAAALGLALCVEGCAHLPGGVTKVDAAASSTYTALLEPLRGGDTTIDFTALRLAYARTAAYSPYNAELSRLRRAMYDSIAAEDYRGALTRAIKMLERSYVDPDAHLGAAVAYRELGETGPGRFHDAVARGLLESVRGLTDGQDPHHPVIVISAAEQFAYMRAIGLEFDEQELGSCNDRPCERIRATDPSTSESVTLYFDVTIQMEWLAAHSRK